MRRLGSILGIALLAACSSTPPPYDYGAYLAHMPRSILVLPPLDTTPEVNASYEWLATVTRPLAERGYYVLPVAMVDGIFKENGLPTPGEMHQVSLPKLREVFGADAVLYVTVTSWGTSYQVINSATEVAIQCRLVDLESGAELWRGSASARSDSSQGQSSPLGMLVSAALGQVLSSASDPSPGLAERANWQLFHDDHDGLLLGPYHPDFARDQERRLAERAALAGG